jgi:hypothetical protein
MAKKKNLKVEISAKRTKKLQQDEDYEQRAKSLARKYSLTVAGVRRTKKGYLVGMSLGVTPRRRG